MTFFQLLEALKTRYLLVAASIVLAVAAGYALTQYQPAQYTSTASLVIDVTETIRSDDRMMRSEPSQAYIATQLDIIRSPAVAARVVEGLDLVDDPSFTERLQPDSPVPAAQRIREALSRGMSATPSRDSQVVEISFTSTAPETSARIANGFADAYLELVLEMSVEPARREAEWFGEQRRDIRQWVEEARERLSGYQQDKGILTSDERVDIETAKLQELSNQVIAAQAAASETVALADELEQQLGRDGEITALPDAATSPVYEALKAEMSAKDARIVELSATLGAQHPRLLRAHTERGEIVARLDREIGQIRSTLRRNAELAAAKHAALMVQLERQRAQVLELNRVKDEIPMMLRDVENAEGAYRLALEQLSVKTLQSRLQNVSATVLHYAEPAIHPSSPSLRTNVAAAGFLGTLFGLVLVVFLEWLDPRVRSPKTLQSLSIPYLGMVETA
jgi:polysaccharide biosynthesis transport protein